MRRRKSTTKVSESSKAAIIVAVIGLIGTAITAYFGYMSNAKRQDTSSETTVSIQSNDQSSSVEFLPIKDRELLVKGFKIDGSGNRVTLRFIANSFDLDFNFSAPLNTNCITLLYSFPKYFAFEEHIQTDPASFPNGIQFNGQWDPGWVLLINGKKVDSCFDQTLQDMNVVDGDLIAIKLEWSTMIEVSSDGRPVEGTQEQPPDIYP